MKIEITLEEYKELLNKAAAMDMIKLVASDPEMTLFEISKIVESMFRRKVVQEDA